MLNLYDNSPIDKSRFAFVEADTGNAEGITAPSISFWKDVRRRFMQNKRAVLGLIILTFIILMTIIGPRLTEYTYFDTHLDKVNLPPSSANWFGTDDLGRDIFTRIWYGAYISLFIGFCAAISDLIVGVIWGGLSGYMGGKVDNIMMRVVDILSAIPYLLVVILFMVVLPRGLLPIIIAMSLTGWQSMARIVRGQVLQLKNQEFVYASKVLGASLPRILFTHLLPNAMGSIIVTITFTIPIAIFSEAYLAFVGVGIPLPRASWGTMANDGLEALSFYPWRLLFPALFICLTIFAFNSIGDGLRDALDPKLRK